MDCYESCVHVVQVLIPSLPKDLGPFVEDICDGVYVAFNYVLNVNCSIVEHSLSKDNHTCI